MCSECSEVPDSDLLSFYRVSNPGFIQALRNLGPQEKGALHDYNFKKSSPEDIFFSLLFKREEGRERNSDAREKHQLVASQVHPTWGSNPSLGICPHW